MLRCEAQREENGCSAQVQVPGSSQIFMDLVPLLLRHFFPRLLQPLCLCVFNAGAHCHIKAVIHSSVCILPVGLLEILALVYQAEILISGQMSVVQQHKSFADSSAAGKLCKRGFCAPFPCWQQQHLQLCKKLVSPRGGS